MMVTNYSNKTWYAWHQMGNIKTYTKDLSTEIIMQYGPQRKAGFVDQLFGFDHTKLPKSYDISHTNMMNQMYSYKHQYKKLQLYKYQYLEIEAKKESPETVNVLWGRLGAKKKS